DRTGLPAAGRRDLRVVRRPAEPGGGQCRRPRRTGDLSGYGGAVPAHGPQSLGGRVMTDATGSTAATANTAATSAQRRALPPVDHTPLRRRRMRAAWVQFACILISLFMALPIVLVGLSALSSRAALAEFPKSLLPSELSTETLQAFLQATGTFPAFGNSLLVGLYTVFWSLVVGEIGRAH